MTSDGNEQINRVEDARGLPSRDDVPLRDHVEKILAEYQRAVNMASAEREKAATALRDEMSRAITEGDRNLRDHIAAQIQQIQAAFVSAELLETQRFAMLTARIDAAITSGEQRIAGLQRELALSLNGITAAIAKQEATTDERFHAANEWRQQANDRERSQERQVNDLTQQFMRQDVAETQLQELRRGQIDINDKMSRIA